MKECVCTANANAKKDTTVTATRRKKHTWYVYNTRRKTGDYDKPQHAK